MEGDMQTRAFPAAQVPTMARPVLDRPPQTAAHLLAMEQGLPQVEVKGRAVKWLMLGVKVQPTGGTPTSSSVLYAGVGAILYGNVQLQPQI